MTGNKGKILLDDIRRFVEELVLRASRNRGGWWGKPLLTGAPADSRFEILRRVAAPDHLLPKELLPSAKYVLVFFLPFKRSLVEENSSGNRPCQNWGISYVETNELIGEICRGIADIFLQEGFASALTPATHNFDETRLMARWSHKHLGFLAGLGRFGIHNLLITPSGCAGRLGSLVTEAELSEDVLIETSEACLTKAGVKCGKCLLACPVSALKIDHFERRICWDRLKENRATLEYFSELPSSTHVCGKCAAMMPCSFNNPVFKFRDRYPSAESHN